MTCRNCGTIQSVAENFRHEGACGACVGCGERVCVACGCTEQSACSRPADNGREQLVCIWAGPPPAPCSFCYSAKSQQLYAEVTR